MIAGPNGSGKSTLIDKLRLINIPLGHYLNADEIDVALAKTGQLDLRKYLIQPKPAELTAFVRTHPLFQPQDANLSVHDNAIKLNSPHRPGYLAAMLSDYLRKQLMATRQSFTFETVMSGTDKIGVMTDARASGYRTYTYYICTNTPVINQERVAMRVSEGGHNVPQDKIFARYHRSLALLPEAIRLSNRAYVFDNSEQKRQLVAEFEDGVAVKFYEPLPMWFVKAYINKPTSSQ
jgi:predicted ABC-type ATPase